MLGLGNTLIHNRFRGGGAIPYLLDTYGGAAAAYSLRQLSSATTNVVRVRRSSDNVEQDFTAKQITDGTLTTFCGVGNGFVTTWYDQSGNSNDATQTTLLNQPQIVSSGSVILENGKPTIYGLSLNFLLFPLGLSSNVLYDTFAVVKNNPVTSASILFGSENASDYVLLAQSGSTSSTTFSNASNNSTHINGTPYTFTNRGDLYNELTSQTLVNLNANYSFIGAFPRNSYQGGLFAAMYISQEIIIYSLSQSSNRIDIENNINEFYSIY